MILLAIALGVSFSVVTNMGSYSGEIPGVFVLIIGFKYWKYSNSLEGKLDSLPTTFAGLGFTKMEALLHI